MFKSRKDKETKNLNRVVIQVGSQQINRDLLDFVVYDGDTEYTISDLLGKVIYLENENKRLKTAIKTYETANNDNIKLITKASQLLSAKVVQLEDEVATLKDKCKYL